MNINREQMNNPELMQGVEMVVKAWIVCENSVYRNNRDLAEQGWYLTAEHGWSVLVETEYGRLLFDTGLGLSVINNAKAMKLDFSDLDGIVLSHNHNDHTGGLLAVLKEIGRRIPVYAHPDVFVQCCTEYDGQVIPNGMRYSEQVLAEAGANFVYCKGPKEILPNIYLTGEIPRVTTFETGASDLFQVTQNGLEPDPVMSDQALVIKTNKGLFVVLGCAHAGIINTLEYAKKITGENRIHTVIGGTHLGPSSQQQRDATIEALKEYGIERLGAAHCTGLHAMMQLQSELGDKFFQCTVGTVV